MSADERVDVARSRAARRVTERLTGGFFQLDRIRSALPVRPERALPVVQELVRIAGASHQRRERRLGYGVRRARASIDRTCRLPSPRARGARSVPRPISRNLCIALAGAGGRRAADGGRRTANETVRRPYERIRRRRSDDCVRVQGVRRRARATARSPARAAAINGAAGRRSATCPSAGGAAASTASRSAKRLTRRRPRRPRGRRAPRRSPRPPVAPRRPARRRPAPSANNCSPSRTKASMCPPVPKRSQVGHF